MEESTATPPAAASGTPLDPREVLQTILQNLGHEAEVQQETVDGGVLLHISTAEPGRLIGRRGQTLSQMQFLVNRILLRACADAPKVTIDCENYRGKQREESVKAATDAAESVRRWGEPVVIGPLSALERGLVHDQFKNDPELEAVSEGDGAGMKKMTIRLKGSAPDTLPAA